MDKGEFATNNEGFVIKRIKLMILTQIQPVESHFQIVNIHNKYLLANLQIVIEFALLT